jgi:AAA15 family ATPase/GTPase
MIRAIELENFKAFGQKAIIPLAPITLIFGENSSGKSSILQAINLLKQTRESRESGVSLLPKTDHGIVDLGSFQDLIFDHDLKKTLAIRIDMDADYNQQALPNSMKRFFSSIHATSIAIGLKFKRPSIDEEVYLDQLELYLDTSDECIARFQAMSKVPSRIKREMIMFYRRDRRALQTNLKAAKCVHITNKRTYWEPSFKLNKENRTELIKYLNELYNYSASNDVTKNVQSSFFEDEYTNLPKYINALKEAIKFYSSDFTLDQYIERKGAQQLDTVIGLDGFIPYGASYDREYPIPEEFTRRPLRPAPRTLDYSLDIGRLAIIAGRALEQTFEMLFPLGPFRRPPERWYIFTGTNPQDVGYKGELLPDLLLRNPGLVDDANSWLERLNIGYKLKVEHIGPRVKDLFEVRLVDTRRKGAVEVGLSDVGYGISQILPFIVQSLSSSNNIISIEQPEVHIHPRLQADLGDLLAESIKKHSNQFIVETHSEHLVLRLQKLIRDKIISPTDISIIYVSRSEEGAQATRLAIDDSGDFIDEWPGGFFPERLRELR